MAKRKMKGANMAMSVMDMKPCVCIDLDAESLDVLKEYKVGEMASLVVKGKVISMSQRDSTNGGPEGTITLEEPDVSIEGQSQFEDLADD